jgi:hypothetical protein
LRVLQRGCRLLTRFARYSSKRASGDDCAAVRCCHLLVLPLPGVVDESELVLPGGVVDGGVVELPGVEVESPAPPVPPPVVPEPVPAVPPAAPPAVPPVEVSGVVLLVLPAAPGVGLVLPAAPVPPAVPAPPALPAVLPAAPDSVPAAGAAASSFCPHALNARAVTSVPSSAEYFIFIVIPLK